MIARRLSGASANGWQLILADLALILFLLSLAGLASEAAHAPRPAMAAVAPSQALYRPGANAPELSQWLISQPRDPRATLTIFARFAEGDGDRVWEQARALATQAQGEGYNTRVVIEQAAASDLYASLAYDAPVTAEARPD